MKKTIDITAMGEILIDFVPDGTDEFGDEKFICKAGGAPMNVLAVCAAAGLKTSFLGKVGNDIFGKKLIASLKKYGVDHSAVVIDNDRNTTLAFVKLNEDGDRDFSFYRRYGADISYGINDVDTEKIASSRVFHFGSLSFTGEPFASASEYALKCAKQNGCTVSYDPNYRAPLWDSEEKAFAVMRKNLEYADIVKMSKEELLMISGEDDEKLGVEKIFSYGIRALAVTDGGNDVLLSVGDGIISVPSKRVKAVDTTGAGDVFFGTFLSEFIKDGADINLLTMEKMMIYAETATEKAAECVKVKGALTAIFP